MMAKHHNVQIQERFVAAVFAGDSNTIKELTDPNFELREGSGLPFAGVYRGAQGVLDFLEIFNNILSIERLELIRAYQAEDADWLASEFILRSVVRATGKVFESTLIETWNSKDGKVLSINPHYFINPAFKYI